MKMELVNDNQLKITVGKEDLALWQITYDTLNERNAKTRRMLKSIMETAKVQTGFDFCNCRLLVEAEPSEEGGLYLLITKTRCGLEVYRLKDGYTLKNIERNSANRRRVLQTLIFKFDNFDDLTDCCTHSIFKDNILLSSVYLLNNKYYMVISIPLIYKEGSSTVKKLKTLLSEYGDLAETPYLESVLTERGEPIILANAIETICESYAVKR